MLTATKSIAQKKRLHEPQSRRSTRQGIALQYHALGFNVLPLGQDKNPIEVWKGGKDGTGNNWTVNRQSLADIQAMPWHKSQGIAAVCGPISGNVCVVDFDKQPDRQALDAFLQLVGLPSDYDWIVNTPGGGFHVWFTAPGLDLSGQPDYRGGKVDRTGLLNGHIELRAEGVLNTLPPSRHPNGGHYRFANGITPDTRPASIDQVRLLAAYEAITKAPQPKPAPVYERPDLPDISDPDEWREVARRVRAEIGRCLVKRGQKPGVYDCPLPHRHGGKDFLFSPDPDQPIGGCMGKHRGELTRWVDLAEHLGIDVSQIARDVAVEYRGRRPAPEKLTISDPLYYEDGIPTRIVALLLNLHRNPFVHVRRGDVPNLGALVAMWVDWHEMIIQGVIKPDDAMNANKGSRLSICGVSYDTWRNGLELGATFGLLHPISDSNDIGTRSPNVRRWQYEFRLLPLQTAWEAFISKLEPLIWRALMVTCYPDLPVEAISIDDLLAEYGANGDEIAAIDDRCQALYATYADQLNDAIRHFYWRLDQIKAECFATASTTPFRVPEGITFSNASQFRDVFDDLDPQLKDGMRENRYLAAQNCGRSLQSHRRSCERRGIVPVPQLVDHPVQSDTAILIQCANLDGGKALDRRRVTLVAANGNSIDVSPSWSLNYDSWLADNGGPVGAVLRVWERTIEKRESLLTQGDVMNQEVIREKQQRFSSARRDKPTGNERPPDKVETWLVGQGNMRAALFGVQPGEQPGPVWTGIIEAVRQEPGAIDVTGEFEALLERDPILVSAESEEPVTFSTFAEPRDYSPADPAAEPIEVSEGSVSESVIDPSQQPDRVCAYCRQLAHQLLIGIGWCCDACANRHTEGVLQRLRAQVGRFFTEERDT